MPSVEIVVMTRPANVSFHVMQVIVYAGDLSLLQGVVIDVGQKSVGGCRTITAICLYVCVSLCPLVQSSKNFILG